MTASLLSHGPHSSGFRAQLLLAYAALGTIYGDIGTSPLYTIASIFDGLEVDRSDIMMGMSLVFWCLFMVVTVKYVGVVLRANNNGEGGTFALYTRLCRVLGVSAVGPMEADDHKALLDLDKRSSRVPGLGAGALLEPSGSDMRGAEDDDQQQWQGLTSRHARQMSKLSANEESDTPPPLPSLTTAVPMARRWWNWGALPAAPIRRWFRASTVAQRVLLFTAMTATGMEFGDGVLTPVVSVVGAVSGLKEVSDAVTPRVVMGVSIVLLVGLFSFQHLGTAKVAAAFSPIVLLWLVSNATIGIYNIATTPGGASIFEGLSPHWIFLFFERYGTNAWLRLGSVMLSVTGAEALFADLGHFSIPAVSISWTMVAFPCLVLTYLGQGAYLLNSPQDVGTTYWSAIPTPVFWPMLILATLASLVASQALISACFSITKQGKALGLIPGIKVVHTSKDHAGQVYVPLINWLLMVLTVLVVAGFNANSIKLGFAYGLTISCCMLITTFLVTLVMVLDWQLSLPIVLLFFGVYGLIDGAFVSSNAVKVPHGAWVSLLIAFLAVLVMGVWWAGQHRRSHVLATQATLPAQVFTTLASAKSVISESLEGLEAERAGGAAKLHAEPPRSLDTTSMRLLRGEVKLALAARPDKPLVTLPGIGLYYAEGPSGVPHVLLHFLRNVPAVHQATFFVWAHHLPLPTVPEAERIRISPIPHLPTTYLAEASYGYTDVVCHDEAFVQLLVEAAATLVMGLAGGVSNVNQPSPAPPRATSHRFPATDIEAASTPAWESPEVEGHASNPLAAGDGAFLPHLRAKSTPIPMYVQALQRVSAQASGAGATSGHHQMARHRTLDVPSEPPRMQLDLGRLTQTLEARSVSLQLPGVRPSQLLEASPRSARPPSAFEQLMEVAGEIKALSPEARAACRFPVAIQNAALRVSALVEASAQGITYYVGRVSLRTTPGAGFLHRTLYGSLYRPMLLLSYDDMAEWEVPVNNMVEIGMVVRV